MVRVGWLSVVHSGQPRVKAMRETELSPVTLRTMTDEDLWCVFVQNRAKCSFEFWDEVENRKAAAVLSERSPFWHLNTALEQRHARRWLPKSNVVELTPEEWEARKRRATLRPISA